MLKRIIAVVFLLLAIAVIVGVIVDYFYYRRLVATIPNAGQQFVLYSDVKQVYGTLSQFSLVAFIGGLSAAWLIRDSIRTLLRRQPNNGTAKHM